VVEEKRTLRSLAAEYGIHRNTIAEIVHREGIPVPTGGRVTYDVDPDWLRTEYIDRRRTLPDIAAEVGTTPVNMARIARKNSIPLRDRGGTSHAASLTAPPGLPEPLASAMLGQGGDQRVRRFQVFARTRSLNEAAGILRIEQTVISSQLDKLEQACGGQLLIRSPRTHRPQQLTDLARLLLRQADAHLQPNPDAPPEQPQLLATALAGYWGKERVRRFVVTARATTIAEAALQLNTQPHTLARTIRGLEVVVGGALLDRTSPLLPHRTTPLGSRLLRQASKHSLLD
jgi:hypothetical protein